MRWRSRLALGAAMLLPAAWLSAAAAPAAPTAAYRSNDVVGRTVSAPRSTESAVVAGEPSNGRPSQSLRPVFGDLPAGSTLPIAFWVFFACVVALAFSVRPRLTARGRAPPFRFL